MRDRTSRRPRGRSVQFWLTCAVVVVGLVAVAAIAIPRVFHRDPCDSAVPFAVDMGLRLSDDEEVVSCETYPSFPDSSVKVMVRTRSPETRSAFLKRCDASEELGRSLISFDDGPFHEEVRRPNLTRSEQVFIADTHGYNELRLSYDEGVESGLLITVWAIDM